MSDTHVALKTQLSRQVVHWTTAVSMLENLDDLASPEAWNGLERYLGLSLRQHLTEIIGQLKRHVSLLRSALEASSSAVDLEGVRRQLLAFRNLYIRIETTLDFFADAINTRTNPTIAALLRACDAIAHRSMAQALEQLGKPTPIALTYLDKGLGASILKAGLRLWDGMEKVNPVAAIKIVRHNLLRPTSLIHETGHQVAHIAGWNGELAHALETGLFGASPRVAEVWPSWASEIAGDAFAFVHTGYASVAALHDVIAGEEATILRHIPSDPHPIGFIRVLLCVEMCRQYYGSGPWDDLALTWTQKYPLERATPGTSMLLRESLPLLPKIVDITLGQPMQAFGGRPLTALINPVRVSPKALDDLECQLGDALYTSMHWVWTEALRLLALTGLRVATRPAKAEAALGRQKEWMLMLGGALRAI